MSCYKPPQPTRNQKIIIFDSPDGTGKTNIAQGLSMDLKVPYFRMQTQERNWAERNFMSSLRYGEPMMLELVKQLKLDIIFDRGYPAEWVYSQVYNRETDMKVLERVDMEFARLGAYIVVPLRRDYANARKDALVTNEMLQPLHDKYLEFVQWTKCATIVIYVDDYKNDLKKEIEVIRPELEFGVPLDWISKVTLAREKKELDLDGINTPRKVKT